MVEKEAMLTTVNNPYNPFTRYTDWMRYDMDEARFMNRRTCSSYIGAIAKVSNSISDADCAVEINNKIDEIVKRNPLNCFRKVYEDSEFKFN